MEQEPNEEDRREQGLEQGETLLGLYRGIPHTARGGHYGEGPTLPDTITLYQGPIEDETMALLRQNRETKSSDFERVVRRVVRETIWHEVAHYFGYDEDQVQGREQERDL